MVKLCALEVCVRDVSSPQRCAAEIGIPQQSPPKICALKVGALEIYTDKVGTVKVGATEIGARQVVAWQYFFDVDFHLLSPAPFGACGWVGRSLNVVTIMH